jgi:hypothetical protein
MRRRNRTTRDSQFNDTEQMARPGHQIEPQQNVSLGEPERQSSVHYSTNNVAGRAKSQLDGEGAAIEAKDTRTDVHPTPPLVALTRDELRDLINRAKVSESAAAEFYGHLENTGTLEAYKNTIRDVVSSARRSLIELCCPGDMLAALVMERSLEAMQIEIAGSDATPLEVHLCERIVLCWLQVNYFEAMFAVHASDTTLGTLYQERLNAAHKRHLSSIKALAQFRKLQIPVLQFNLADKQVNIGHMDTRS